MSVSISMRKRRAREGEVGLFCDAQLFEEEWAAFKIDSDVDVVATTEAHAKYRRFSFHVARLVMTGTGQFNHVDDARDAILKLCRHVDEVWDNLRGELKVKVRPTRNLSAEEWVRLVRRMAWYAEHTFGIPPEEMSRSPYAPTSARSEAPPPNDPPADDTPPADDPSPDDNARVDETPPEKPRGPQTEQEYIVAAKRWLATLNDPASHWSAREHFSSDEHVKLRQTIKVSLGVRKQLEREIDDHFVALKSKGTKNGT